MQTDKEMVDEILALWKNKEYGVAKSLLQLDKQFLSPRIYNHLYKKMGIIENQKIPKILLKAKEMMGGKLFDQYDMEILPDDEKNIINDSPENNPYRNHPWFKKNK